MKNKKLLFISHNATRTGAPLFLLKLLEYYYKKKSIDFQVLFTKGGELISHFEKLSKIYLLNENTVKNKLFKKLVDRILGKNIKKYEQKKLVSKLKNEKFDLIYSNTIANGEILEIIKPLNCKVITHVHELEYVIQGLGQKNLELVKKNTDFYIAASKAVEEILVLNLQINKKNVIIVNNFIINKFDDFSSKQQIIQIKTELDLPEKSFIVGSAGTVEWRKGYDLFIYLASIIKNKKKDLPIYFVWVGAFANENIKRQIEYDLKKAGLKERVFFVGQKENPAKYFSIFDVFTLMSREEAFGIVGIETAYMQKPVLCFDKAGGFPEFIENDAGFIIPYLNVEKMAEKILYLYENPEIKKIIGTKAKDKVRRKYLLEQQATKILEIISNI